MKNCWIIGLPTLILAVAGLTFASAPRAPEEDEEGVRQAMAQFYAALNDLFEGEIDPMKAVWSHADDVTYMGPTGGMQVGWDQVLPNWEAQAAKKLGGEVKPERMHVTLGQQLAIAACYVVGENIVDGKPQKVSIRATSLFRKEDGRWKMIGHHTDLLPFLAS